MKVVLVKEDSKIRILEGKGEVSGAALMLRSRMRNGEVQYYSLDYDESLGMRLDAYIVALNKFPELLNKSNLISKIS